MTIKLKIVPGHEFDTVLDLWDTTLNASQPPQLQEPLAGIPSENTFAPLIEYNIAPDPVRSILSSVRKHYNVFGILEEPYLDLEFWDSHGAFYGSSFTKYPVECKRLHFFEGDEGNAKELLKYLQEGKSETEVLKDIPVGYRGYCVFRPTPSYVIGRSAIQFDTAPPENMRGTVKLTEEEEKGVPYLTMSQECEAHLGNAVFTLDTPEFIQQDPNLGQCATASLWVATGVMARRCGTQHFRYGTITRQAIGSLNSDQKINLVYDGTGAAGGLTVTEIRNALAASGAKSFAFAPTTDEAGGFSAIRLKHEIYSFVESGFPVLLCISPAGQTEGDGHVVAAVGHSLPRLKSFDDCTPLDPAGRHYLLSELIDLYYCHDDAYGPFNRIAFTRNMSQPLKQEQPKKKGCGIKEFFGLGSKTEPLAPLIPESTRPAAVGLKVGRYGLDYNLQQIVVATSPYIKNYATQPLTALIDYFDSEYAPAYNELNLKFLWRSMVIEGYKFKQSLEKRGYSPTLRKWYSTLHLPKFIWLYEVSIAALDEISDLFIFDDKNPFRMIAGEFIFDATCPSYDISLIAERVYSRHRDFRDKEKERDRDLSATNYRCYTD